MSKKRLDNILVERGMVLTRAMALAMILAGEVYVGGQRADKAGRLVDESAPIEIRKSAPEYVSRSGIKLAHALKEFDIHVSGYVCVDVGASTGGFTDCLLKKGAKKVYAVDVGYGQLDVKLRSDKRVVVLERTNIKDLDVVTIEEPVDLIVIDLSFIGLEKVFPKIDEILACHPESIRGGLRTTTRKHVIALIKPQFQVGKGKVGRGGVVRDEVLRKESIEGVKSAAGEFGWRFVGVIPSPIRGPKGNIEYLAYWHTPLSLRGV